MLRQNNASKSQPLRVVLDECAGPNALVVKKFQQILKPERQVQFVILSKLHRAIPDSEILHKVMAPGAVLVTMDRVLHNQACHLGFRSYTLNARGDLTRKKLPNVMTPSVLQSRGTDVLKEDYTHGYNPIASALKTGLKDRDFKRNCTRRRRIRNYFGSESNICQVAVTIGEQHTKRGSICGFYLTLAGYSGVKRIRASEGYAISTNGEEDPAQCLIHAVRDLHLLQLEKVPVELYIIPPHSLELCRQLIGQPNPAEGNPSHSALSRLLNGLESPRVFPCLKGRFFDQMNDKLNRLARAAHNNELVPLDFAQIVVSLNAERQRGEAGGR